MMTIFRSLLTTVTLVSLLALVQCNGVLRKDELHARQLEAAKRYAIGNLIKSQQPPNFKQDGTLTSTTGIKNITFSNPVAGREFKFHVQHPGSDWNV